MENTRDKILQTLLRRPRATTYELAEAAGINPVSARHHLTNLQAEGLVRAEEERHGVGRPRLVYFLTENGLERFPTRYLRLTTRLLSQMKERLPGPLISELFKEVATGLAQEYQEQLHGLDVEGRLNLVQKALAEEGFLVEWEKKGGEYHIHEITCPYLQVSQAHPEVCAVDQTIISTMLAVPAHKIQCRLSGAAHCTYVVQNTTLEKTP